jgi:hypothetical protein
MMDNKGDKTSKLDLENNDSPAIAEILAQRKTKKEGCCHS